MVSQRFTKQRLSAGISKSLSVFAIAATLSTAVLATEPAPDAPYQPDGQWRLTKLADGCSVSRDFVKDEERVTLSIKRIHPGAAVQFAVIGAPILRGSGSLQAGFLPAETLTRFDRVAAASIGEREGVVFAGRLVPAAKEGEEKLDEADVTDFVVIDPRDRRTTLHTRAIDQAISALDDCAREKLLDFGLDLEAHSQLETHVVPKDVEKWAGAIQRSYPAEALRMGWGGTVPLRLIVDERGRVTHCHVTDFLTAEVLRDTACKGMIEHARFTPAIDAEGRPSTDFTFQSIRYTLAPGQRGFSADAHGFAIPHDD